MKRDLGTIAITIGCAAIPVIGIVAAGAAGIALLRRQRPPSTASTSDLAVSPTAAASPSSAPPVPSSAPDDPRAPPVVDDAASDGASRSPADAAPSTADDAADVGHVASEDLYAITVPDPHHVDPVDLLSQARRIARAHEAHAALVSIYALEGVTAGTVDITSMNAVTYDFEWRYGDPSQPPGKDDVQGGLWITAKNGRFDVMDLHHASAYAVSKNHRPDPGPDPRCSARDAWRAAVRSGVPDNAVARMRYEASFPGWAGQPYVWVFRVPAHEELRRDIDGMNCMLRR
jgi:hypothetical protein